MTDDPFEQAVYAAIPEAGTRITIENLAANLQAARWQVEGVCFYLARDGFIDAFIVGDPEDGNIHVSRKAKVNGAEETTNQ